jgi:alkylation response protein AidB-like acyl-CoA dehydrogenase
MNFDLDDVQSALVDAVGTIFERIAVRPVGTTVNGDGNGTSLLRALDEAGYLDLYRTAGPLEAALVVEEGARAAALAPLGARLLVAPALMESVGARSVALAAADDDKTLVRYAPGAELILIRRGDDVVAIHPAPEDVEPVGSPFGYPLGRLLRRDGESLGPGTAATLLRWWRVALAVEMAACMKEALRRTIEYTRDRAMFGKTLGSYQAVQHRLSELHIRVEGARWLARDAAWAGAPADRAATAAAFAADAAKQVLDDCHQFHGAIGFTLAYPLHLWTMRLQALRVELGGAAAHQRAAAAATWP